MRSRIRPVGLGLKSLALLIAVALTGLLLVGLVLAQESGEPWYEPVNLSRSAGTSEPVVVIDASGRTHVIWKDAGTDFAYTLGQNGTWREAQQIELPFGTRRYYPELTERQATPLHTPVLWADGNDRVHAAWLDLEGQLLYSSVPATRFEEFSAWSAPQQLATSALGATAIVDDAGIIHVAYIRATSTAQSPSGLYHRESTDGGETWSAPALIYESQYFRSMAVEQINMHLAAADNGALVAAWDNPFEERVYIARSGNGGQDWESPVEVDRRVQTDAVDAAGPNSIQVESVGDQFHLVWEAGHEGFLCAQYHQMSSDAGLTWESPQLLTSRDESCADTSFLVAGANDALTLFSMAEERGYVSVWNGSQWGETQTREQLASFTNPANFRPVTLACYQVATGASGPQGDTDTAIIIGCDTGTGDDVWALSVALGPLNEELAPQSSRAWQRPEMVSGPTDSESLQLLADADGWLHASWVQRVAADDARLAAYYSRWDGIAWSQPNELLRPEEDQSIAQPTLALGPDDTLMAVWLDGEPGRVYFGQADVARASNLS
ncbi:MAG: sialidase family protein, partial [Chloroflexota bacterium]